MRRNTDRYRRVFVETYGEGPWPCHGCDQPVTKLFVHHLDEDEMNDEPSNLVAMHRSCHQRLHQAGRPKTPEHRRQMSESRRGKPFTDEHRRNISIARRRRTAK